MGTYYLVITTRSETTFGRGDGVAGLIDQEVVHDEHGFPYFRGRTLKGVLSEECDGVAARLSDPPNRWNNALHRLFGSAGSTIGTQAHWHYGDAMLPADLRAAVAAQQTRSSLLTATEVLDSLTTLRHQTAMDAKTGTPNDSSLRVSRVILRELTFTSQLTSVDEHDDDLLLLAAGCLALRHLGAGRTRGRGAVRCRLLDAQGADCTAALLQRLKETLP